jgi:hypothetical protein
LHPGTPVQLAQFAELIGRRAEQLTSEGALSAGQRERIRKVMADIVDPPSERASRIIEFVDGGGAFFAARVPLDRVTLECVLRDALGVAPGQRDRAAELLVVRSLKRHGWVRRRETTGARAWYYARPYELAKDVANRQESRT